MFGFFNSNSGKRKKSSISSYGNANGFRSQNANNMSGRAIKYDNPKSTHGNNSTPVLHSEPKEIRKLPIMCDGSFNVYVNNNGFLVHEDPISSGYSVSNVCLARLSYNDIKLQVLYCLGDKVTKRKEKFAIDTANYIVTVRGFI